MWIVPLEDLTPDQLNAINLSFDKNRIVIGAPGAGKTLVLAHRAKRFIDTQKSRIGVKVLIYTNVLVKFMCEGMEQIGFQENEIETFDKWCLAEFNEIVGGQPPKKQEGKRWIPDFDEIHKQVLEAAEKLPAPRYNAIFVDEGQDLSETAVRLLGLISKHVTIAMDSKQQMYTGRVDLKTASDALGIPKQASQLLASYRCTALIRDIASELLANEEDAKNFRSYQLYGINGVEKPIYVESEDVESEWDVFAELIKERALLGQTCAILLPTTRAVYAAQFELEKRNVAVSTRKDADFTDLKPELLTFHSAKGLTVDAVFVPGLTEAFFSSMRKHGEIATLLFVGLTRAARWLCLGTRPSGTVTEIADAIESLVQRGSLVKYTKAVASAPDPKDRDGWL